jgi:hypothetical protein
MPLADGRLTDDEKQKILDWFTTRGSTDHRCPVCNHDNWDVGEHFVQPVTLGDKYMIQLSGYGYPQVMIICTQCAHTQFFNAVLMGLIPPDLS